jgi:tRNA G18 (ribose-2'-O)-methylase SpoU
MAEGVPMSRGFFAIGIENGKTIANLGTLWRSANIFGAAFIFTVGRRYKHQSSDTLKTPRHVPLVHYADVADLLEHLPHSAPLVGVELSPLAAPIAAYRHHERAVYLLGAEDHGLSKAALKACHDLIVLPGDSSLNVSVAGSVVMFDRHQKRSKEAA